VKRIIAVAVLVAVFLLGVLYKTAFAPIELVEAQTQTLGRIISVPRGHVVAFAGEIDDKTLFVIHRPRNGGRTYVKIGPSERMVSVLVTGEEMLRDGGTTWVHTSRGTFNFPSPLQPIPTTFVFEESGKGEATMYLPIPDAIGLREGSDKIRVVLSDQPFSDPVMKDPGMYVPTFNGRPIRKMWRPSLADDI